MPADPHNGDEEREGAGRPRPRVVDKRVSAAPPDAEAAPPTPEPTPEPPPEPVPAPAEPEPSPAPETIWTPEQEAEAQRMAQEIAATPSRDWVLNVAITLANVAGTKIDLGARADAGLAIDTLAAIVNGVGSRLDEAEAPLRQTLAQLQLAYAQSAGPPPAGTA